MSYTGITQTLQTTAFGDLDVAAPTPIIQLQFPYNINTLEVNTAVTGSGTVTFSQPFAVCSTGAAATSSASLSSHNNLHYASGQGGLFIGTAIFTTGAAGSTQWIGLANTLDGLWFGYNGATFGINRQYNGTTNFVAQSSWNIDPMNGTGPSGQTLVPTNGNVYKIQYQWLGFGDITFSIENAVTGLFQPVHRIQFANSSTTTSLLNPAMQVNIQANNTTNATNISIKSPCLSAFREGEYTPLGNNFSIYNSKSLTTTQTSLFTLRNNTTFNAIQNYKQVLITGLSFANGAQISEIHLVQNATLGGTPAYTNINAATSVSSYDVAGTTVTGGTTIATFFCAATNYIVYSLESLNFSLEPGDTLTFSAANVAGAGITLYGSFNWIEQF